MLKVKVFYKYIVECFEKDKIQNNLRLNYYSKPIWVNFNIFWQGENKRKSLNK